MHYYYEYEEVNIKVEDVGNITPAATYYATALEVVEVVSGAKTAKYVLGYIVTKVLPVELSAMPRPPVEEANCKVVRPSQIIRNTAKAPSSS